MDYEKKYEKLIDAVKVLRDNNPSDEGIQNWVNDNVPELRESEDERIKKSISNYINVTLDDNYSVEKEKWLGWLEKQGNIDKASYEIAEKEKYDFVNGQFIQCRKSFGEFKEYNSYWFEYVGNDTYVGRSDNILNKKFHITPRQLYRLFTQQHDYYSKENNEFEKQGEQKPDKVEPKFKVGDWFVNNITKDVFLIKSVNSGYCTLEDIKGNIISPCLPQCESESHLWTIQDAKDGDILSNGEMIVIFKHFEDPSYRQHIVAYIGLDLDGDIQITDGTWMLGIDKAKPATKEQRDLLFQKIKKAGYEWNAEKKELSKIEDEPVAIIPKFKVGDIIRHKEQGFTCKIIGVDTEYRVSDCCGTHLPFDCQDYYELVDENHVWSEEDERLCSCLIEEQEEALDNVKNDKYGHSEIISDLKEMYNERIDWLKSLKDRVQPQWKPSEEQMKQLKSAADIYPDSRLGHGLKSLYQDLTKLNKE